MKIDYSSSVKKIQSLHEELQKSEDESVGHQFQSSQTQTLIEVLVEIAEALISVTREKRSVEVANPVKSVRTPDMQQIVSKLDIMINQHKDEAKDDSELEELKALRLAVEGLPEKIEMPEGIEEVTVKNIVDYTDCLERIEEILKNQKTVFEPSIEVKASDVVLDQKELVDKVSELIQATKAFSVTTERFDDKKLLKELEKQREILKNFKFPMFPSTVKVTNPDGTEVGGSSTVNPLSIYTYIQKDTSGATYKYYGYADATTAGGWLIKRITIATNLALFQKGTTDYTTAWSNRASGTYGDIWSTF